MAIDQQEGPTTPQVQAPRTTEQQLAGATSASAVGYGRRSARGHGYELRDLSYVPSPARTRAASGGCIERWISQSLVSRVDATTGEVLRFEARLDTGFGTAGGWPLGVR